MLILAPFLVVLYSTIKLASPTPIIIPENCKKIVETRTGDAGVYNVTEKPRNTVCVYRMEVFGNLHRDVIAFDTRSMQCLGNGGVTLPIISSGKKRENICGRVNCVAFTRRSGTFSDEEVLAAIGNTFPACKAYDIIKKSDVFKIKAGSLLTSFTLLYKVFIVGGTTTTITPTPITTTSMASKTTIPGDNTTARKTTVPRPTPETAPQTTQQPETESVRPPTTGNPATVTESGNATTQNPGKKKHYLQIWKFVLPIGLAVLLFVLILVCCLIRRRKQEDKTEATQQKES